MLYFASSTMQSFWQWLLLLLVIIIVRKLSFWDDTHYAGAELLRVIILFNKSFSLTLAFLLPFFFIST